MSVLNYAHEILHYQHLKIYLKSVPQGQYIFIAESIWQGLYFHPFILLLIHVGLIFNSILC